MSNIKKPLKIIAYIDIKLSILIIKHHVFLKVLIYYLF